MALIVMYLPTFSMFTLLQRGQYQFTTLSDGIENTKLLYPPYVPNLNVTCNSILEGLKCTKKYGSNISDQIWAKST